eukprot:gnl/TRDRNA2_/TRDRNA2_185037_c0_seq1.p1 gnl/TRDRNA2_/TRDRNA2_185037_c0~~gnl/TRDRNA2_/TRDRNA2_185037_c0_seq1.p1  ORF type:complete len:499 (-),score=83.67 gnl/TRDRNA2_/TRDRNA2_185037_c0_seq1:39-1535(-)
MRGVTFSVLTLGIFLGAFLLEPQHHGSAVSDDQVEDFVSLIQVSAEHVTKGGSSRTAAAEVGLQPDEWVRGDTVKSAEVVESHALSSMLVGVIAFIMVLFYLVNHYDADIRLATWKMVSGTVSVFSAVLLYRCVKRLVIEAAHQDKFGTVVFLLGLFLIFWLLAQGLLLISLKKRCEKIALVSQGTILGRVSGFAATFSFAAVQELPPFKDSSTGALLVGLIAAGMFMILSLIAHKIRELVVLADDGVIDDDEKWWLDEVEIIEEDMISFALGFLLMQAIRFHICGALQVYDPAAAPVGITQEQTNALLMVSLQLAGMSLMGTWMIDRLGKRQMVSRITERFAKIVVHILSLTMAWCVLFWGDWQVFILGIGRSRVAGCMAASLSLTFICVVWLFVLDFVADHFELVEKALRSFVLTLGVIVGGSWSRVFNLSFADISHTEVGHHPLFKDPNIDMTLLVAAMLVVVLPAWRFFILPKTADTPVAEESLPPVALNSKCP